MEFNAAMMRSVRKKMQGALDSVEVEGCVFKVGNCRYSPKSATFKVEVRRIGYDPLAEEFKFRAYSYGLRPDDLGRKFKMADGSVVKLVGAAPKARKFKLIGERSDGRAFKYTLVAFKAAKRVEDGEG